jgi:hypothetical protein
MYNDGFILYPSGMVQAKQSLRSLLKRYEGMFKDNLRALKGVKVKLHVNPQAKS